MAIRVLAGMLLALAGYGGVLAAGAARPALQPATWQVKIGGESADHALQAQAFFPTTLTVDEGDTVNWAMDAAFVHTVTFLSGQPAPQEPIPSGEGDLLMLNPVSQFPSGGPAYDGTGYVNSGVLDGRGVSFALTFTKAGSYGYICLLHPGMAGSIVVQAAGSAYPATQAQVDAQASAELYAKLGQANQQLQGAQLASQANADGTTTYTVINGVGGNQSSVLRFLPVDVAVKAGDSVAFPVQDPHEIHTVTFYDPAGQVPPFVDPRPQASGPPKLIVPHALPQGGTRVESQGLYNSGIIIPGQSYTFTFPKPGVYSYVCVVHAPQGMFGKVTVAATTPASLPTTGAGGAAWPIALAGALALLLGLVARRAARARAA
jgi:plastocyanin